eukprot:scaffold3036_cov414-Prasinococcus_capsulatus_cf.AAC.30
MYDACLFARSSSESLANTSTTPPRPRTCRGWLGPATARAGLPKAAALWGTARSCTARSATVHVMLVQVPLLRPLSAERRGLCQALPSERCLLYSRQRSLRRTIRRGRIFLRLLGPPSARRSQRMIHPKPDRRRRSQHMSTQRFVPDSETRVHVGHVSLAPTLGCARLERRLFLCASCYLYRTFIIATAVYDLP